MLIASATLVILFVALCLSIRPRELPMDRDVILRIRRFADDLRREQLLPYD
jgi:hypothetical protein